MLKKYDIGWKAITLACVALVCLATVLTFADASTKATVIEWLGWGGFALSQFIKPMLAKKKAEDDERK